MLRLLRVYALAALLWHPSLGRAQEHERIPPADVPAANASAPDVVETIDSSEPTAASAGEEKDITLTIGDDDGAGAGADGDYTETLGTDAAGPSETVAPEPSAQPETSQTKMSGWARESLEFYAYERSLHRKDPSDVTNVPRDRIISRLQLLPKATYQRGSSFEATVSGLLGMVQAVQNGVTDTRLDARLQEAYLGFYGQRIDLRIGQQRVAWGVADIFSPNDVINARDLRDPLLAELEATKIPTPLARLSYYQDRFGIEALLQPVFVPDRTDLYGRNWAAIQPDAPQYVRGLFGLLAHSSDASVQEQLNGALLQTRLPSLRGRGIMPAFKLSYHGDSFDMNFYYQYGYDGLPYVALDPAFASVLKSTDFATAGVSALTPVLRAADAGLTPMVAEYIRRHHLGMDAVGAVGPFMLRIDAAIETRRVFYRTDLTSIANPAFLAVASLDYQTGSTVKVLVLEAVYIRVIDPYQGPLLIYNRDSYGLAGLMRWPLVSIFSLEARVMFGISPLYVMAQPALIAKLGSISIKAGGVVLQGDQRSFGWLYRHNSSAFLQALYAF